MRDAARLGQFLDLLRKGPEAPCRESRFDLIRKTTFVGRPHNRDGAGCLGSDLCAYLGGRGASDGRTNNQVFDLV
jgi:hypothetical protein